MSYFNVGDSVLVPQKDRTFEGTVTETEWKNNGMWVTVEVEYTDMTGTKHKTRLRPTQSRNLIKKKEQTR